MGLLRRVGAIALGCFAYGVLVENQRFQVRRVTVPVLPAGAERIRILHFSDVHLLRRNAARIAFIRTLAGLEPDVVVGTGDNVAEPEAIAVLGEALGRLLQVPGVYVFGSSDYETPHFKNPLGYVARSSAHVGFHGGIPTDELEATLSSGGWRNLNEKRVTLEVQGLKLEFRGTNDAHLALDDYPLVAGKPASDIDLAIGVTHAPYQRVLDAMVRDRVKLILAGHTHGGQVCVPLYGALTTNCDLNPKYAKGLSRYRAGKRSSYLNVSAGLGTSPYAPYRFACPPEVTLLTLTER
ncbi:MAG: metallophosphoesterase [Propionibacteriaceae bacterium]|jgi:predicted MPP superfamily phosphohydrolase|nr:metallophosphoesterase [Propionibacteriaceae bacterium]